MGREATVSALHNNFVLHGAVTNVGDTATAYELSNAVIRALAHVFGNLYFVL